MENLNIVELIETNPITKLSNTYNNKLLSKIKEQFNEDEQKMFITSFYCYLNYNQNTDYIVDLDNIWKWLGFNQKVKAKILLEKNFIKDIDYINLLSQMGKQDISHGGHNKEIFMLTINAFKLFCIKASTEKAKQIHKYFIKLEGLLHEIIEEESNELKMQLSQLHKIESTNKEEFNKKIEKEKEKILLREFGNIGSLVYLIKVKTYDNNSYVIKIGESRKGVQDRFSEHKTKYDEVLLLDCFIVNRSKDFESFLHNTFKDNRVTNLIGHENEKELFLIDNNLTYTSLLKVIKTNIKHYNDVSEYELEKIKLENEKLKLENEKLKILNETDKNIFIQELLQKNNDILFNKIECLEKINKEILEKLNATQPKITTNFNEHLPSLGPRVQKINPDNLQIIKVYESISECMKEDFKIKRPSINKAIINNTIYIGFRWLLVDRDLDPNIIHDIKETKKLCKTQNLGYIAKLDKDKSEIINIYIDRKTASEKNNYPSFSSLDNPVKKCTLTNGHYYMLYEDCDEELKSEFKLKNNNEEPLLYKDGVGQFDSSNNLLKEFVCKYDCIRTLHISDRTLKKAMDGNKLYNSHYYKFLEPKIFI